MTEFAEQHKLDGTPVSITIGTVNGEKKRDTKVVAGGFHLTVIIIVVFHHNEGTGGADTDPSTWLYPVGRLSTECLAKLCTRIRTQ